MFPVVLPTFQDTEWKNFVWNFSAYQAGYIDQTNLVTSAGEEAQFPEFQCFTN